MLNVGKGVQKQKVHVFLQGRGMFRPPYRRDLGIWLIGFAMTTSAMLFFPLGVYLSDSPSAISSMTGIGLIGLLLYAVFVIGERTSLMDAVGIVLVIFGTMALGYLGSVRELPTRQFDDGTLVWAISIALSALAVICLVAWRWWRSIHGVSFGMAAGLLIGTGIFLTDCAQVRAGESFLTQLQTTPYLYVAFVFAIAATVVTQLGFLRGRALEVVPGVNSATILSPLVFEIFVYRSMPVAVDLFFIGAILAGVFLLSTGTAARVSEDTVASSSEPEANLV